MPYIAIRHNKYGKTLDKGIYVSLLFLGEKDSEEHRNYNPGLYLVLMFGVDKDAKELDRATPKSNLQKSSVHKHHLRQLFARPIFFYDEEEGRELLNSWKNIRTDRGSKTQTSWYAEGVICFIKFPLGTERPHDTQLNDAIELLLFANAALDPTLSEGEPDMKSTIPGILPDDMQRLLDILNINIRSFCKALQELVKRTWQKK